MNTTAATILFFVLIHLRTINATLTTAHNYRQSLETFDSNLLNIEDNNKEFVPHIDDDDTLQEEPTFKFSKCNRNINKERCMPWSRWITKIDSDKVVKIPCGKCVEMDITTSETIFLPKGLDIAGKLQFTRNASVTIRTKFVFVQGILKVSSPQGNNIKIPHLSSQVKIILEPSRQGRGVDFYPDPDGDNMYACGTTTKANGRKHIPKPCPVDHMPFVVAGGKLSIRAINHACPTWLKLIKTNSKLTMIRVDKSAFSCWNRGAELLLTSDSFMGWKDHEIVKIKSVNKQQSWIELEKPLNKPKTTMADDETMAVEVALLDRNFIIDVADHAGVKRSKLGGHLIVMNTPGVDQVIEGVSIRHFGQLGIKGRYPLHLHLNGNLKESSISRNVIRDSFQRCIVIHGTHNVTISNNVAYNHLGHCFMLEDGGEMDNTFTRNLGALSRAVPKKKLVGRDETDDTPGTFWITNPMNHLIGNVAAGSEAQGIWLELRDTVRGPSKHLQPNIKNLNPQLLPGGIIRDNIAHSNIRNGMTLYLNGWFPPSTTIWHNPHAYKNGDTGVFFHATRFMTVNGGYFSDNAFCVRNHFADLIVLRNVTCVGQSRHLEHLVKKKRSKAHCGNKQKHNDEDGILGGISFQPNEGENAGITLQNVTFRGFSGADCDSVGALYVEPTFVHDKLFDNYQTFEDLTFDDEDDTNKISACDALSKGVRNIAIEDSDGSIGPTGQPGFLVQDDPAILSFLDQQSCTRKNRKSCLRFCERACLRLISFETNPAKTNNDIKMVITNGNNVTQIIPRSNYYWTGVFKNNERSSIYHETKDWNKAYYGVALPPGNYSISFVNGTGGVVWPDYVGQIYNKRPVCAETLGNNNDGGGGGGDSSEYSFTYDYPDSDNLGMCHNIIKNGDFESGVPDGWQQHKTNFAMISPGAGNSRYALATTQRSLGERTWSVGQSLDISCLRRHARRYFEIKGKFRLRDGDKNDVGCDESLASRMEGSCPTLRMRHVLSKGGVLVHRGIVNVGKLVTKDDGLWANFRFEYEMPMIIENIDQVYMFIDGAPKSEFMLDDWSMTLLPTFSQILEDIPWDQINGKGRLAPVDTDSVANNRANITALLSNSPNKIIWRKCLSCEKSHVDIYYKRWTPFPDDMDIIWYLENNWRSIDNCMGADFSLYSSYGDAIEDVNRWEYCNYDNPGVLGRGFPGECGPETLTLNQWNNFDKDNGQEDVAFMVERDFAPTQSPTVKPTVSYYVSDVPTTAEPSTPRQEFSNMPSEALISVGPTNSYPYQNVSNVPTAETDYFSPSELSSSEMLSNVPTPESSYSGTQLINLESAYSDYYFRNNAMTKKIKNLALDGFASQSCTYTNKDASLAIDGDTNGNFRKGSVSSTCNEGSKSWWMVDLGAGTKNYIDHILIYNRRDAHSERLTKFFVQILDESDSIVWERRQKKAVDKKVKIVPPAGTIGQYVRILIKKKWWLQLAEVEVMGYPTTTLPPTPAYTNLALQGIATQACTLPPYGAELAIDDNTSGHFKDGSTTSTCCDVNPYWMVDLGNDRESYIHTITIYNRLDHLGMRLKDFSVEVLNANQEIIWNFRNKGQLPSKKEFLVNLFDETTTSFGRYVRIRMFRNTCLQIAEVQVWGYQKMLRSLTPTSTLSNLALTGRAEQSCTLERYRADLAIDGRTNGNFKRNSVSSTCGNGGEQWWKVYLPYGSINVINAIIIHNRRDCCGGRLTNFYLEILDDDDVVVWDYYQDFPIGDVRTWDVEHGITGRSVQIRMPGDVFLQLAEVQVLGNPLTTAAPTPTLVNAALGQPTWQSCTHKAYASDLAVDGNTNGILDKKSVSHTCMEHAPWWRVDLGSLYKIVDVIIYNRSDCCTFRLREFDVQIMNENADVVESKYFNFYVDEKITMHFDHASGRFVQIRLRNEDYLQLAEVEVMVYRGNRRHARCNVNEEVRGWWIDESE